MKRKSKVIILRRIKNIYKDLNEMYKVLKLTKILKNINEVKEYIKEKYNLNLTGEEMMFLTIHLKRISTN